MNSSEDSAEGPAKARPRIPATAMAAWRSSFANSATRIEADNVGVSIFSGLAHIVVAVRDGNLDASAPDRSTEIVLHAGVCRAQKAAEWTTALGAAAGSGQFDALTRVVRAHATHWCGMLQSALATLLRPLISEAEVPRS
jgi:hypothetical protein